MKNVYIVNECLSSAKNGIGTYLNELLYCLKAIGAEACLLTFNADCKEFNVTYSNKRTEMNFPCFPDGDFWQLVNTIIDRKKIPIIFSILFIRIGV